MAQIRVQKRRAGLALAVAVILPLAAAQAEELAQEGQIDAVVTDTTSGKALDLGGDRTLYALDSTLVVRATDGQGLLHDMTGQCFGLEEVENATGAGMLDGYCTYIDADGDKIFETLRIERSDLKSEATGEAMLSGGTGKFEGISGKLTHTRRLLLPGPTDDVFPGIGKITGSYAMKQGSG